VKPSASLAGSSLFCWGKGGTGGASKISSAVPFKRLDDPAGWEAPLDCSPLAAPFVPS
jgi:hypothetical protein